VYTTGGLDPLSTTQSREGTVIMGSEDKPGISDFSFREKNCCCFGGRNINASFPDPEVTFGEEMTSPRGDGVEWNLVYMVYEPENFSAGVIGRKTVPLVAATVEEAIAEGTREVTKAQQKDPSFLRTPEPFVCVRRNGIFLRIPLRP